MNADEDPGWRPALRALIPFVGIKWRPQPAPDGITTIRSIFVGMVSALPLIAYSLTYIVQTSREWSPASAAVIAAGLDSHTGLTLLGRRPLTTDSLDSLSESWRTRWFLGVGLAEIPALLGFSLAIVTDALWVYLPGMAFGSAGFWRVAPTKASLRSDQERLRAAGSPLDLTEALMTAGPYASGSSAASHT